MGRCKAWHHWPFDRWIPRTNQSNAETIYVLWRYGFGVSDYDSVARYGSIQYIPRNMHTVFALLCFVVVIHWLILPYPSGLLHWHCGNLTIAPVPAKQPWWIWINTSCEFIMNDCITTTKQSTTKPFAYFLGYTVHVRGKSMCHSRRSAACYLRVLAAVVVRTEYNIPPKLILNANLANRATGSEQTSVCTELWITCRSDNPYIRICKLRY